MFYYFPFERLLVACPLDSSWNIFPFKFNLFPYLSMKILYMVICLLGIFWPGAASRWRLGKLLNILHRTVPTTKNYPVQNVSSATVENPCSKIANFRLDHTSTTTAHQASPLDEIREPVVLPRATLASWNQQESLPVFPLFSALFCQGSFPLPSISWSCLTVWKSEDLA